MVHDSVLDVVHDEFEDDSDYEDGCEEEEEGEEAGQLQSGFKALDISRTEGNEGFVNEDGEILVANDTSENGADKSSRTVEFQGINGTHEKNQKKKKKKKKRGERRRQSAPREKTVIIERFVVQTCRRIEETKYPLFREAVDRIGIEAMKGLLNQVDAIQKCGGQMTADGLRRRSAGGVLWNLLRDHVGPVLYKEIMKEGNRKHIEQQKAKQKERGTGKRQHMDVDTGGDERPNVKRCRTSLDADRLPREEGRPGRGVSRERPRRVSLREEVDSARVPAALQNAWIQGLKKQSERGVPPEAKVLNPKASAGPNPLQSNRPVSERIRMAVSYGDLVEEGHIATDSPIHGVTEVYDSGVQEWECGGQINRDHCNIREGEMEEGEITN